VYGRCVAKTIQIRNVPDDLHQLLRNRASAAGMSLSDYLLQGIREVAARPATSDVLRRAGERSGGIAPGLAAEAVRSDRDR